MVLALWITQGTALGKAECKRIFSRRSFRLSPSLGTATTTRPVAKGLLDNAAGQVDDRIAHPFHERSRQESDQFHVLDGERKERG
jgi:hypothetical protein